MCGIGGIKRLVNEKGDLAPPILPVQVDMLVNSLEYRGNDATGVALVREDGEILVMKDHEPAWKFTSSPKYREWLRDSLDARVLCAMVHTRKATKGTPYKNENNHPLHTHGGVVVHNGMISNDDTLFAAHKLDRGAETDSDILRALLDEIGEVNKKSLNRMSLVSGSVAAALVHPKDPSKLMLLRSGNPLVLAADENYLFWASDKRAIYRAARPWIKRHGFLMQLLTPRLSFVSMPNDTGYIVGPKGLEWHDKFTSSLVRWRCQTYSDVYSGSYAARQERHKAAAATLPETPTQPARIIPISQGDSAWDQIVYIWCPNPKCEALMMFTKEQMAAKKPLSRYKCKTCGMGLEHANSQRKAISPAVN